MRRTGSQDARPGAKMRNTEDCIMQRHWLAGAAGVLCLLMAEVSAPLGNGARAAANDVSARLDDCQDDEIYAHERLLICSELVDDESLSREIRAEALVHRGVIHLDETRLDAAMTDFERALALNGKSALAHAYRGEVHRARGYLDRALADYDTAIGLYDASADLYANRGQIHLELGATGKAKADFEAALRLEQKHDVATKGLKALAAR